MSEKKTTHEKLDKQYATFPPRTIWNLLSELNPRMSVIIKIFSIDWQIDIKTQKITGLLALDK